MSARLVLPEMARGGQRWPEVARVARVARAVARAVASPVAAVCAAAAGFKDQLAHFALQLLPSPLPKSLTPLLNPPKSTKHINQ